MHGVMNINNTNRKVKLFGEDIFKIHNISKKNFTYVSFWKSKYQMHVMNCKKNLMFKIRSTILN